MREAEVEDLDVPVGEHEDVVGLQVAVDDAFAVRGREPAATCDRNLHRLATRQRAVGEPLAERRPSSSSVTTKS